MKISELKQLTQEMGIDLPSQASDEEIEAWLRQRKVQWLRLNEVPPDKRFVERALSQLAGGTSFPTAAELLQMMHQPDQAREKPPATNAQSATSSAGKPSDEKQRFTLKPPVGPSQTSSPPKAQPRVISPKRQSESFGESSAEPPRGWSQLITMRTVAIIAVVVVCLLILGNVVPGMVTGVWNRVFHGKSEPQPTAQQQPSPASPSSPATSVIGPGMSLESIRLDTTPSTQTRMAMSTQLGAPLVFQDQGKGSVTVVVSLPGNAGGLKASPSQTAAYLNQQVERNSQDIQELAGRMNRVEGQMTDIGYAVRGLANKIDGLSNQLSPPATGESLPEPLPSSDEDEATTRTASTSHQVKPINPPQRVEPTPTPAANIPLPPPPEQ